MKAMGKSSISSVVKILLDISWYMAALGLGLACLMILYTSVWGGLPGNIRIPITFELDSEAYEVGSPSLGVRGAVIDDIRAYLSFPLESGGFPSPCWLSGNYVRFFGHCATGHRSCSKMRAESVGSGSL